MAAFEVSLPVTKIEATIQVHDPLPGSDVYSFINPSSPILLLWPHYFHMVKLKTVFRPRKTLRNVLMNVKNRVPDKRRKDSIYEIPCRDCECVCVGETGRMLKKQMLERKLAIWRFDLYNDIAAHVQQKEHHIDWNQAKVVGSEEQYWRRRVAEAAHAHTVQAADHELGLWPQP